MSWSGGRFSSSALAVKSDSGSASTNTALLMSRKLSVVATSTSIRDGRSARAQTTPESIDTSPDCTPWVIWTRSGAKLSEGRARPPIAVRAAVAVAVFKSARRVSAARRRIAIGPPPSQRGGKCALILTKTRTLCDDRMTLSWTCWGLFQVPVRFRRPRPWCRCSRALPGRLRRGRGSRCGARRWQSAAGRARTRTTCAPTRRIPRAR